MAVYKLREEVSSKPTKHPHREWGLCPLSTVGGCGSVKPPSLWCFVIQLSLSTDLSENKHRYQWFGWYYLTELFNSTATEHTPLQVHRHVQPRYGHRRSLNESKYIQVLTEKKKAWPQSNQIWENKQQTLEKAQIAANKILHFETAFTILNITTSWKVGLSQKGKSS